MAKVNWIDCRCYKPVKEYSDRKWKELTGWPVSRIFTRLSDGLGIVSVYDQRVIKAAQGILGYLRKMAPVGRHSDEYVDAWRTLLDGWRDSLNEEVDKLSAGVMPRYLEDEIKDFLQKEDPRAAGMVVPVLTVQAALLSTEFKEWSVEGLAWECKRLIIAQPKEKEKRYDYWRRIGHLDYFDRVAGTRYNIRVSVDSRHGFTSKEIRRIILLPYTVDNQSEEMRAEALEADLKKFTKYYEDWRKPRKDEWRRMKDEGTWSRTDSDRLAAEEVDKFRTLLKSLNTVRPLLEGLKKEQKDLLLGRKKNNIIPKTCVQI